MADFLRDSYLSLPASVNIACSDDLAYAHAVINSFGEKRREELEGAGSGEEEMPIHLARIVCPVGAQSLNDCTLGDGWGSTQGCTHALDVGVICGPETPLTPLRMRTFEGMDSLSLFCCE